MAVATERQRQVQEVVRLLFQEFPTAPLEVRAQLQKDQSFELEEVEVEAEKAVAMAGEKAVVVEKVVVARSRWLGVLRQRA